MQTLRKSCRPSTGRSKIEAGFVAKVLQETAALPTRKRKKNYPKGASPPQSESESESDEDTQRNPAPKPSKKSKSTATTTNANSPPPNHADDANEAAEDSPDVAMDTSGTSGVDGDAKEAQDSPSDVAVGTSGTSHVDGDDPFDSSDVVEFDPIANRGPFDDDDDDAEDEGVQTSPPSVANKSATKDTSAKDTSATPADSANESSLPASTSAASTVAAPSAVADTSPTEDTSATPAASAVESSLPPIPALPANVPIIMGPHHNSSRAEYLSMPSEQVYCSAVDTVNGLYYDCWLCGSKGCDYRVKSRRPFTLYSWTQHEGTGMHTDAVAREKEKKRISDKVKSKDPTLTDNERLALVRLSKVGSKLSSYFSKKPKAKKPPDKPPDSANNQNSPAAASIDLTQDQDGCESTPGNLKSPDVGSLKSPDVGSLKSPEVSTSQKQRRVTCEGVYVDFRKTDDPGCFGMKLSAYGRYRSVSSESDYKVGMCGSYYQVFARECNLNGAQPREPTTHPAHDFCAKCHDLFKNSKRKKKITQGINNSGSKLIDVEIALRKRMDLTPTDYKTLNDFKNTPKKHLSEDGLQLYDQSESERRYYKNMVALMKSEATSSVKTSNDFVPSKDDFIAQFTSLYNQEKLKTKDQQNLVVGLAQAFVAKANGYRNSIIDTKVLNLSLALHAYSPKTYKLAAANLPLVSERHVRRVSSKRRETPIIHRTADELTDTVTNHIKLIRDGYKDQSMRVAVSVGVDATVLVKGVQVLHGEGVLTGLASPNHWLEIQGNNADEITKFVNECRDGKHGVLAGEIKFAILSFQQTPIGVSPYLIFAGVPQTINENNSFASDILATVTKAADMIGNVAVLNDSTDGVSCEVKSNYDQIGKYLTGETNQLSFPDPNHNVKNYRYQEIGGSGFVPAVIGNFIFDVMLLKMAGVPRELLRIDDFASDAIVLRLASHSTVGKLLDLETADVGNKIVTIVSLTLMRIRSSAVNAPKLSWNERATMHWASTLWCLSYQTQNSTRLPNKRNMLLEAIAVLFLCPRDDVVQLRRATSEANEHTYGMLRQILREFTVEQLIYLVNKVNKITKAIYEGGLVPPVNDKGYQATLDEYVKIVKEASAKMPKGGPIEVDLSSPAVNQLWDNVRRIMNTTSSKLRPFLKLFGVVEGNGLTVFASHIETTDQLLQMVKDYFKPPKRDLRGFPSITEVTNMEDVETNSDDDDVAEVGVCEVPHGVLLAFMQDIAETEAMISTLNNGGPTGVEEERAETSSNMRSVEESFHGDINSSKFFLEFKLMLQCEKIEEIGVRALKIMELLQLGKMEKGSITSDGRYRSLNARWFGCKVKRSSDPNSSEGVAAEKTMIKRDTLVKFRASRGKNESVEYYRVLAIFSKHYNKWFIHWDSDQVEYIHNSKKYKILARMVKMDGMSSCSEVNLEADGQWNTKSIFTLRSMCDIVSVEGDLDSSIEEL